MSEANKTTGLPEGNRGRDWTTDEYQAAMRAAPAYLRRLLVFLKFSSARPGEARAMQWAQIRPEEGAIIQDAHKTGEHPEPPRRIFLNHVSAKLIAWLGRNKAHRSFVFTDKCGRPWTRPALCSCIALVRERAGLRKEFSAIGGRYMFATRAFLHGLDAGRIAAILGHSSVETTRRYAQPNAAAQRAIEKPDHPGTGRET